MKKIVLASTSQSRKSLLERLKIPFETFNPDVDETPLQNENPQDMVLRLAIEKAKAAVPHFDEALIIGADQIGVCENEMLGKPLTLENSRRQLKKVSGKRIRFYIGLCVIDSRAQTLKTTIETYDVLYRSLTDETIENYLRKEQPLQCAGASKVEGLGIVLMDSFEGKDYTALIGLPLISLTSIFKELGFDPLT